MSKRLARRRPSAATMIALVALVLAASGTAVAASHLVSGDKLIKKRSLSGNRLRNHTITGKQVNLKKLGKVPSAANADHASSADHATNADHASNATSAAHATSATTAGNATTATKIGTLLYRTATFPVALNTRATAHATCPSGTFAVGGGSKSPDESSFETDFLIDSHPTNDRTGWEVTVENFGGSNPLTETVYAVCMAAGSTG
jgi:hypothetical protein